MALYRVDHGDDRAEQPILVDLTPQMTSTKHLAVSDLRWVAAVSRRSPCFFLLEGFRV